MKYGELPADYALDALSEEALRRGKNMGRPDYSYGKLVVDTTEAEREQILEDYRRNFHRKYRRRKKAGE